MQSVTNNPGFMQQLRSDLHWLINSPTLIIDHAAFLDNNFWQSHSIDIDKALENTVLVDRVFGKLKPMVGLYFERLVLFWLKSNPAYSHVQQHIRLQQDKRTVGEMDFLFDDAQNQITFHWEVSVKYFLLYAGQDIPQLIGPNPADTFETKYHKMLQRQLPLSQSALAKNRLSELGYHFPLHAKGIVKGCLFYPSNTDWRNPPQLFDAISKAHCKGWWTSINHLAIPAYSPESRWVILSKPYWFALENLHQRKLYLLDDLTDYLHNHFNMTHHGVFLAELMQNENQWLEVSRGFVVNANWPHS